MNEKVTWRSLLRNSSMDWNCERSTRNKNREQVFSKSPGRIAFQLLWLLSDGKELFSREFVWLLNVKTPTPMRNIRMFNFIKLIIYCFKISEFVYMLYTDNYISTIWNTFFSSSPIQSSTRAVLWANYRRVPVSVSRDQSEFKTISPFVLVLKLIIIFFKGSVYAVDESTIFIKVSWNNQ